MRRSRTMVVVVLVLSLLATGATRWLADEQRYTRREGTIPTSSRATGSTLSGMNSYALALLLGGLRGPLVMVLWSNSEAQKVERDLEGFNTQIEWIRLLQPEFDTVIIYQTWNLAYNISVQMASLANKYATILDALEFARRSNDERPHNLNILSSIAQVYFDKLGNSQEKEYYRAQVRQDSMWREMPAEGARAHAIRHMRLAPRLDPEGNILEQYLRPTLPRPEDHPADAPWANGADLQYLAPYQPFDYGITPFAFAYNYYKRVQVLQEVTGQRHAQLSPSVIDSRPAIALRFWTEEERGRGLRLEAVMYGVRPYSEAEQEQLQPFGEDILEPDAQLEVLTADAPMPDSAIDSDEIVEAIWTYGRAAQLATDAVAEYQRHLRSGYGINITTYGGHISHVEALHPLLLADKAYLQAMTAAPDSARRREALQAARSHYEVAIERSVRHALRYYVDVEVLQALGVTRQQIDSLSPERRMQVLESAVQRFRAGDAYDTHRFDRGQYERFISRSLQRIGLIEQAAAANPQRTNPQRTNPQRTNSQPATQSAAGQ